VTLSQSEPSWRCRTADDDLVRYIRQNSGRYTQEAIREQLLAAGHPPDEIDAAFAETHRAVPSASWGATLRHPAFWVSFAGYLLAFVAVYFKFSPGSYPGPDPATFWTVVIGLLLLGLVGATVAPFSHAARRGIGCAMVTVVLAPVVLAAGLFVYCLVAA